MCSVTCAAVNNQNFSLMERLFFFLTTVTLGFINSQGLMPKATGSSHIWVTLNLYSSYLIREEKAVDAHCTDGFVVMKASPSSYDLGTNVLLHTAVAKIYCKLKEKKFFLLTWQNVPLFIYLTAKCPNPEGKGLGFFLIFSKSIRKYFDNAGALCVFTSIIVNELRISFFLF